MSQMKPSLEQILADAKTEPSLAEILEIVRIAQASEQAVERYEDRTRPIINSKTSTEEIKVMHYTR